MRAYLLTIVGAVTLFNAYGASFGPLSTKTNVVTFSQGATGQYYDINVNNNGSFDTDGSLITITDTLPTGLSNPVWENPIPAGWTCTTSGNTATCTSTNVIGGTTSNPPNGQTVGPFILSVDVSNTAPATITNCVTISGGGAAATANICDTDQSITPETYLTIRKVQTNPTYHGNPLPVASGQSLTYKLDVDNIGGAPSTGTVTVVDTLASDMIVSNVSDGGGYWTCNYDYPTNTVTCTTTNSIPGATSPTSPGEAPNIYVTAAVLGTNANDTATVTYNGLTTGQTSTASVTSTVEGITNVTFTSNQTKVEVDGEIYPSGITIQENTALNHSVYAYPNCKISAITGLSVVESRPGTAPPWTEVTGQITASTVAVTCH